jgi:hypothetical protein
LRFILLFNFLHDKKTGIEEPIHTVDETALFAARKATRHRAGYAPVEKQTRRCSAVSHTSGENGLLIPAHFGEVVDLAMQTRLCLLLLEKLLEFFL